MVDAIRTGDGDAAAAEGARHPFMCLRKPTGAGG